MYFKLENAGIQNSAFGGLKPGVLMKTPSRSPLELDPVLEKKWALGVALVPDFQHSGSGDRGIGTLRPAPETSIKAQPGLSQVATILTELSKSSSEQQQCPSEGTHSGR